MDNANIYIYIICDIIFIYIYIIYHISIYITIYHVVGKLDSLLQVAPHAK